MANIQDLMGKTITKITGAKEGNDEIIFECSDGKNFEMHHYQDCCESVTIDDICGDINDLIGTPIVRAEEPSNTDEPEAPEWADSYTWTFYILGTNRGTVTIRWFGVSNGYYSERVDFDEV